MKVLITKASNDSWYYHKVGEIVEVEYADDNFYKYIHDKPWSLFIKIKDCEETKEKYMNDKMYLKSIAVSFENTKQREDIERKFTQKGFKIYGLNFKEVGYKGYTEKHDCIANLSDYGLKDKTIISYEEFIGGNNMNDNEILKPTDYKQFAENIAKVSTNSLKLITENELSKAKLLLEQNGYKVEPPYIPPTDSEICERIKSITYIAKDKLFIADYNDATYTFKSHKALTKWIIRLIKCK